MTVLPGNAWQEFEMNQALAPIFEGLFMAQRSCL
jgi:hypothetical protein